MDFQTHQQQAKQNTFKLVALLICGIVAITLVVTLLLVGLTYATTEEANPLGAFAVAAPITTLGIVGASLFKSSQIKGGGGAYVAESLGGRVVDFNTLDPAEKQLANVVEEIAIASGMPVPAVYVLENEPGINAFAAGWTADNAAIGVTRGTLQNLNRRELQGVIAHEFSHIRNGDTRVKTRIIAWVFGIAILTIIGRLILQHMFYMPRARRRQNGDGVDATMVIMAAAVGLLVIGFVGTIFARMIQAAVSRQREYLADASAVQYTRDPSGIGEALMKIGGMGGENRINAAHATEASHLFFSSPMTSAMASHPPLADRISKLIPSWNGEFRTPRPQAAASASDGRRQNNSGPWGSAIPGQVIPGLPDFGLPVDPVILASATADAQPVSHEASQPESLAPAGPDSNQMSFGEPHYEGPGDEHIAYARQILDRIPVETQNFLHTRHGAVAATVGLLLSEEGSQRAGQLSWIAPIIGMDAAYLDAARGAIGSLDRPLQLPAIDIALHSIRELPVNFKSTLSDVILRLESTRSGARSETEVFRWILRRVVIRHLEDQYDDGSMKHQASLSQLKDEASLVYAMLAFFNSSGPEETGPAFAAASAVLGQANAPMPTADRLTIEALDSALERLSDLAPTDRVQFVDGAAAAVLDDGRATADEAELIRVVADAVRLPVPPLLPVS